MGIPLCAICCFSLATFNICSLCLIFVNLIKMCLGVFCLGFILFTTLWFSWTWMAISFPILGKFSTIIFSSIFSYPFFWSPFETPMIQILGHLIVPEVSEFVLTSFNSFFLSASIISIILSFTSFILSSACLSYSTVDSLQSAFDLSYCIIHC